MKQITIRLDIFDWSVHYFFLNKKDKDINEIADKYKILDEDRNEVNGILKKKYNDGGLTLSHMDRRLTLVFIYPPSSKRELFNLIGHETWHVVDRIMEQYSVKDVETPALTQGYLLSEVLTRL